VLLLWRLSQRHVLLLLPRLLLLQLQPILLLLVLPVNV
jgi:hypothetical protein